MRFFDEAEHKRALVEMQGASGLGGKPIKVNAAVQKGCSVFLVSSYSLDKYHLLNTCFIDQAFSVNLIVSCNRPVPQLALISAFT